VSERDEKDRYSTKALNVIAKATLGSGNSHALYRSQRALEMQERSPGAPNSPARLTIEILQKPTWICCRQSAGFWQPRRPPCGSGPAGHRDVTADLLNVLELASLSLLDFASTCQLRLAARPVAAPLTIHLVEFGKQP